MSWQTAPFLRYLGAADFKAAYDARVGHYQDALVKVSYRFHDIILFLLIVHIRCWIQHLIGYQIRK